MLDVNAGIPLADEPALHLEHFLGVERQAFQRGAEAVGLELHREQTAREVVRQLPGLL